VDIPFLFSKKIILLLSGASKSNVANDRFEDW
jgi:hypothetical protein